MSNINTTSIEYMEQLMKKCLKASPSWYMSDICSAEIRTGSDSYETYSAYSLSSNAYSVESTNSTYFTPPGSYSGSHDKSFVSGIRRSGCRVPF